MQLDHSPTLQFRKDAESLLVQRIANSARFVYHQILSINNFSAIYKQFMQCITNDIRFQSYCVLFSRIVPIWVMFSVVLLMFMLLASQDGGLHVMIFTVLWTIMLCIGIGFCVLIRKYVSFFLPFKNLGIAIF